MKMHSTEALDSMTLDEFLIDKKESTYLLKVGGDSMAEAGILKGDLVLVERGRTPKVGDIVVALDEGEYKLEYFTRGIRLQIEAVVRSLIRKYK